MRLSINTTYWGFSMTKPNERAEQRRNERAKDEIRRVPRKFIAAVRRMAALQGRGAAL